MDDNNLHDPQDFEEPAQLSASEYPPDGLDEGFEPDDAYEALEEETLAEDKKALAVASLVLGIVSFLGAFGLPYLTVLLGALAFIFGFVSRKSSRHGIAVAGMILGFLAVIIGIGLWIFFILDGGETWSQIFGNPGAISSSFNSYNSL